MKSIFTFNVRSVAFAIVSIVGLSAFQNCSRSGFTKNEHKSEQSLANPTQQNSWSQNRNELQSQAFKLQFYSSPQEKRQLDLNSKQILDQCNQLGSLVGIKCEGQQAATQDDFEVRGQEFNMKISENSLLQGTTCDSLTQGTLTDKNIFAIVFYSIIYNSDAKEFIRYNCLSNGRFKTLVQNTLIDAILQSSPGFGGTVPSLNCQKNHYECDINMGLEKLIRKYTTIRIHSNLGQVAGRTYNIDLFYLDNNGQQVKIPGCKRNITDPNIVNFDGICDSYPEGDHRRDGGYIENKEKFRSYSLDLCYTDDNGARWTCAIGDKNIKPNSINDAYAKPEITFAFDQPQDSQTVFNSVTVYALKSFDQINYPLWDYMMSTAQNEFNYTRLNTPGIKVLYPVDPKSNTNGYIAVSRCNRPNMRLHTVAAETELCSNFSGSAYEGGGFIYPLTKCQGRHPIALFMLEANPSVRVLATEDSADQIKNEGFVKLRTIGCADTE